MCEANTFSWYFVLFPECVFLFCVSTLLGILVSKLIVIKTKSGVKIHLYMQVTLKLWKKMERILFLAQT